MNQIIDPNDYTPEQRAVVERVAEKLPAFLPVNDGDVPRPFYMRTSECPRWMLCQHGPELWACNAQDGTWHPVWPNMTWWAAKKPGEALSPLGEQFHIHLYPMVRVRINGCFGWGGADAIRRTEASYWHWFDEHFGRTFQVPIQAGDWGSCPPGVVHVEFADELVPQALLDVPGDTEHEQTAHWDLTGDGWVKVQIQ